MVTARRLANEHEQALARTRPAMSSLDDDARRRIGAGLTALFMVMAVLLSTLAAGVKLTDHNGRERIASSQSPRALVIIVPGTYGNERFWPHVLPGNATFGSELLRAVGGDSEVHPFLWASDNDHLNRMQAAINLADLIDQKARDYDRVCLVGHSHGGSVRLAAAGICTWYHLSHRVGICVRHTACRSMPW